MQWDAVHVILALALGFLVGLSPLVAFVVSRVYRKSERIEGITAAIYLEAREVLSQYRP